METRVFVVAACLLAAPIAGHAQFRTIDGSDNNRLSEEMGMANTQLRRQMNEYYSDYVSSMGGQTLLSPRELSNIVASQRRSIPNRRHATDFVWQWGQFLDHDIDLTPGSRPAEVQNVPVPAGDPFFDPMGTGNQVIEFTRSIYDPATGTGVAAPRQQLNMITAWIDGSNVYGSDETRAMELRTLDGTGKLRTSAGNLLPFNTTGLANAGGPGPDLFLAGDVRANEQVALTAMHTLFVREHNRLAELIASNRPELDGEQVYQRARHIVGAQMQVITYKEFIPALLGRNAIKPYRGYRRRVDAGITNEFSTAAYRFGHSMLNEQLRRYDHDGRSIGDLPLRDAFFAPQEIIDHGIEPLLRGLASQRAQRVDPFIVDALRNFLFGPPGSGGLDLAALNIQRGRDHGLPSYNQAREHMGLSRITEFSQISSNPAIQARLAAAYRHVDEIELWIGCLAEDPRRGALVGELAHAVLKDQFERLRDGDRFWYARRFTGNARRWIESTTLADIIRRNTNIGSELQDNVFRRYR